MKAQTAKTPTDRSYGYDLWYHSAESEARELPAECGRVYDTSAERDAMLARYIPELQAQGYIIDKVTRVSNCGRCGATGQLRIAPKGKRSAPWWMCRIVECPECHGAYRVVETEAR